MGLSQFGFVFILNLSLILLGCSGTDSFEIIQSPNIYYFYNLLTHCFWSIIDYLWWRINLARGTCWVSLAASSFSVILCVPLVWWRMWSGSAAGLWWLQHIVDSYLFGCLNFPVLWFIYIFFSFIRDHWLSFSQRWPNCILFFSDGYVPVDAQPIFANVAWMRRMDIVVDGFVVEFGHSFCMTWWWIFEW